MLALRLAVMHNLYFYNKLTERIRDDWTPASLRPSARNTAKSFRKERNLPQKTLAH